MSVGRRSFINPPVAAVLHLNVASQTGVEAGNEPWKDVQVVEFRGMEEDAEHHQHPL